MGGNLFGIGFGELIFIAILALVIFGPKRIPEIARTIGRVMRQIREATSGIDQEVRELMDGIEPPQAWLDQGPPAHLPAPAGSARPPASVTPEQGEKPPEKIDPSPPTLSG